MYDASSEIHQLSTIMIKMTAVMKGDGDRGYPLYIK